MYIQFNKSKNLKKTRLEKPVKFSNNNCVVIFNPLREVNINNVETVEKIEDIKEPEPPKPEFKPDIIPILEKKPSVKELVDKIENKAMNIKDTDKEINKEIPEEVKKVLNKLLFVSRYKNIK